MIEIQKQKTHGHPELPETSSGQVVSGSNSAVILLRDAETINHSVTLNFLKQVQDKLFQGL
jgi:hypothetical protein